MDDKRDKGRGPSGSGKPGSSPERGKEGQGRRRFGRKRFGRGPRPQVEARPEGESQEPAAVPAPVKAQAKGPAAPPREARAEVPQGGQGASNGQGAKGAFGRQSQNEAQGGRGRVAVEKRPETIADRPDRSEKIERPEPTNCPLCGKPVFDLSTAVGSDMATGAPAHFDCVLERVAAAETLGPGERLVYLGSGSFGVVEYRDKSESAFTVKRRIQWEKEGEKKEWRRGLSARITKI